MPRYVLSIDQGTTSSRAMIFNESGRPVSMGQTALPQHFPNPGWVEHDPYEIFNTVMLAVSECLSFAGLSASDLTAIGITNQRETTVLWDSTTGKPVYNAIVWQSRQSSGICDELKAGGLEETIRKKTGLVLDSYFSGSKIAWAMRNVEGLEALMIRGRLRFGTIDTWLVHMLTGGKFHITDPTNASRTLLFDINRGCWDNSLLSIFGVEPSIMPEVCSSSGILAYTDPASFFGARIPICGIAGDQQAALFGQLCCNPGDVKSTYGTGGFLLMHSGRSPVYSDSGLLTTVACSLNSGLEYALEGSIFVAGSAIQWLRDGISIIGSSSESEALASSLDSNDGVYFVPAFVGLGTPYWKPDARGTMTGITRGTTRAHLARAALESVAYQTRDVLEAMAENSGIMLASLKVDGGMADNDFLMGFLAEIAGIDVVRPDCLETTALGAAYLAGLGSGIWESLSDIASHSRKEKVFSPQRTRQAADELYRGWKKCLKATIAACS